MDTRTAQMIQNWLRKDGGDREALARWMAALLNMSRPAARALITEAVEAL